MLRAADGEYAFLEVNTRLQVEHGVTELATGVDLVRAQILLAAGWELDAVVPPRAGIHGAAVEARVYAEDPRRFFPSPGPLEAFRPPRLGGVRVDTGYAEGQRITPYYDPLLAKVIVRARDREAALERLRDALEAFEIVGIRHNIPALLKLLDDPEFRAGRVHTDLLRQVVAA